MYDVFKSYVDDIHGSDRVTFQIQLDHRFELYNLNKMEEQEMHNLLTYWPCRK